MTVSLLSENAAICLGDKYTCVDPTRSFEGPLTAAKTCSTPSHKYLPAPGLGDMLLVSNRSLACQCGHRAGFRWHFIPQDSEPMTAYFAVAKRIALYLARTAPAAVIDHLAYEVSLLIAEDADLDAGAEALPAAEGLTVRAARSCNCESRAPTSRYCEHQARIQYLGFQRSVWSPPRTTLRPAHAAVLVPDWSVVPPEGPFQPVRKSQEPHDTRWAFPNSLAVQSTAPARQLVSRAPSNLSASGRHGATPAEALYR